jgi:hypothetical protein
VARVFISSQILVGCPLYSQALLRSVEGSVRMLFCSYIHRPIHYSWYARRLRFSDWLAQERLWASCNKNLVLSLAD